MSVLRKDKEVGFYLLSMNLKLGVPQKNIYFMYKKEHKIFVRTLKINNILTKVELAEQARAVDSGIHILPYT
jgi:hypothetical protein